MSVLHVLPTFDTGGLGGACLSMIRAWPEKTVHHVIAPKWVGWHGKSEMLPEFVKLLGGNAFELGRHWQMNPPKWAEIFAPIIQRGWNAVGAATHVIQYNVLDLVYTHFALMRAKYKGRVLAHVGTILPDVKRTRQLLTSRYNENTYFIPVHRAVADGLIAMGTPPAHVLGDVWNATNLDRFEAPFRQQARVFGFAARMGKPHQKNWQLLIEAFKLLVFGAPDAILRFAGDGDGRAEIESWVRAAGLTLSGKGEGGQVEFCGNVSPAAMPDFMKSLDVFVMSSFDYEGFANVISEAIAARCMMLGTDVPGVRLPFSAGGGEAFLAKDSHELAALMRLLNARSTARADNQQFVEKVRPRVDARTMAQAYYDAGLKEFP